MITTFIIIYIIGLIIGSIITGVANIDDIDLLAYLLIIAIWPITLAGCIIMAPFYGLYKLGIYIRKNCKKFEQL